MKNTARYILFVIATFLIVGCQNSDNGLTIHEVSGDYEIFQDVDKLADASENIVRARIIDFTVSDDLLMWREEDDFESELEDTGIDRDILDDQIFIFTIYTVDILDVYKGDIQVGEQIEFMQLGGQIGNVLFINNDEVEVALEDDLILFLSPNDEGPAMLLNPIQTAYHYSHNASKSLNHKFKSVDSENNLELTSGDLNEISDREE